MTASRLYNNVERWLVHQGLRFKAVSNPESTFCISVSDAGSYGVPIEMFEPKSQPGVLVVGAKVSLKDGQIARYLGFSQAEKKRFEDKVSGFCASIRAVSRNITEDGKPKIGVYVVLDSGNIIQQDLFDAMDRTADMHEMTARFLIKTF